jgi:hypothetical protein
MQILDGRIGVGLEPVAARLEVDVLGERLGQPVGERLDHDRVVVVVLGGVLGGELLCPDAGGDRERPEVVSFRGHEIDERPVRAGVAVVGLLAEEAEARARSVVTIDNDIVAVGRRRPEAEDTARDEQTLVDDPVEQALRVVEQLPRRRLLQDRRELPLQLPGVEEELPVDVLPQRCEIGLDETAARELGLRQVVELHALPILARPGEG